MREKDYYGAIKGFCLKWNLPEVWNSDRITGANLIYEVIKVINAMINELREYEGRVDGKLEVMLKMIEDFLKMFNEDLNETVLEILLEWKDSGVLEEIINQALFDSKLDKTVFESFKLQYESFQETVYGQIDSLNTDLSTFKETTEYRLENLKEKIDNHVIHIYAPKSTSDINILIKDGGHFQLHGTFDTDIQGIKPQNNTRLDLTNATLKQKDNSEKLYYLINIKDVDNVEIYNGLLIGDKETHTHPDPMAQEGHGINIVNSQNIRILGTSITQVFGDGIYLGHEYFGTSTRVTKNIIIDGVSIYKASRNGISICGGEGIYLTNGIIEDVRRIAPFSCIDLEPEGEGTLKNQLKDVFISNMILKNAQYGILWDSKYMNDIKTAIYCENITMDNTDYGLTARDAGLNSGEISFKNIKMRDIKNVPITIENFRYDSVRLLISDVYVDQWNTGLSNSLLYSSGIVLYNTKNFIVGNVLMENISLNRTSTLAGSNKAVYGSVELVGKGIKNVVIDNIKANTYLPFNIVYNEQNEIVVNKYKGTYEVGHTVNNGDNVSNEFNGLYSAYGNNTLNLKNTICKHTPITYMCESGTLTLNSELPIYPFGVNEIKTSSSRGKIVLYRYGGSFYTKEMVGTWVNA